MCTSIEYIMQRTNKNKGTKCSILPARKYLTHFSLPSRKYMHAFIMITIYTVCTHSVTEHILLHAC